MADDDDIPHLVAKMLALARRPEREGCFIGLEGEKVLRIAKARAELVRDVLEIARAFSLDLR